MKQTLLILTCILLSLTHADIYSQTVYATSQTNAANGVCVGCSVIDPQNCVSPSLTDYSTINMTVSATGAFVYLRMQFPSAVTAGTPVYAIVEDQNEQALTSLLMASIRLTSYMNSSSNNDTRNSSQYTIQPYSGTQYIIGFAPSVAFNTLEVRMVGGIAGALNALRVYAAFYSTSPLPVEIVYFNASPSDNDVTLRWTTATETNNDHFTIERSHDGMSFDDIGIVEGAGNSVFNKDYLYEDKNVDEGTWYYRLKQTDLNGDCSYSNIAAVLVRGKEKTSGLYPNPCEDQTFYIDITEDDSEVQVITMSGEKLYSQYVPTGCTHAVCLPKKMEKGIYFVSITSRNQSSMKKLIVK